MPSSAGPKLDCGRPRFVMKLKPLLWFCFLESLVCLFVFRDALWGQSLLAPLDIAPALFSKYQFVDPNSSGVPGNHYIVDQLFYDLPIQKTIYDSLRRGEIPWWDPYTFGGRPLLADAHINGTDPVRLILYGFLPFERAYNWTRIIHFVLTGAGMAWLLSRFGFSVWTSILFALTYQFAGGFTLFFGHPWIQASFIYYPFLWLAWDAGLRSRARWSLPVGALLVAAIFYSGNLQSHAYLVLFSCAFAAGYAGRSVDLWRRSLVIICGSGLIGGLLAMPVLSGQLEFFLIGSRQLGSQFGRFGWATGLASASAIFPWSLGTFRTLDLSKFFGQSSVGFVLWIGCAGIFLAGFGLLRGDHRTELKPIIWAARILVVGYLILVSTPMVSLLYLRVAPLAVIGLIVLAASGFERLCETREKKEKRGLGLFLMTATIAIGINVVAFLVYPAWRPEVTRFVESKKSSAAIDDAPRLREFQIRNFPDEVSFGNPEVVVGCLSLCLLAILLWRPGKTNHCGAAFCLLWVNLIPVLMFAGRYIPRAPMEQWVRLQAGGAEQQKIRSVLRPQALRLFEIAPGPHDQLFPYALAHLYQVHVVHGYSALRPNSLTMLSDEARQQWSNQLADWIYESKERGQSQGSLIKQEVPGLARFQWRDRRQRQFLVKQTSLNSIELDFESGGAGSVLWTDTYFPGWQARVDGVGVPVEKSEPCFSRIQISSSVKHIVLTYRPRFLTAGIVSALVGLASLLFYCAASFPMTLIQFGFRSRHTRNDINMPPKDLCHKFWISKHSSP